VRRDAEVLARLRSEKWKSLVVWECETCQPGKLQGRLLRFLEGANARY
jgi:G:T-mismatch repair DNA endonuclease (very short patch repair protein)